MTIAELVKQAHETAKEKGWWDKEPSFGELIALCHSELSEALEEFRNGVEVTNHLYECAKGEMCFDYLHLRGCRKCEFGKPVGIPAELADVIIRIADLCGHYGIDLESAIREKMEYNKNRPYRHGNKVI